MTYVEVAVSKVYGGGKFFTYHSDLDIHVGAVIKVPFGNKSAWGIATSIVKKPTFKTKSVELVSAFNLTSEGVGLLFWMIEYYADDIGTITQLFLPKNPGTATRQKQLDIIEGQAKPQPSPTLEQATAIKQIDKSGSNRFLLHGDTGSGKTYVYINKAKKTLATGKSILILTPEIGLTPQLVSDLGLHLNAPVVLTHSNLTDSARRRIWEYAQSSRTPTVYVGPRSALFLPISQLGLIIIDEAHDNSYKQGQSPRYNSLNVAGMLAKLHNAMLIQGTATPNVSDYVTAQKQSFNIIRMREKAAGKLEGGISLVDITDRDNFTTSPHLSDSLIRSIGAALAKKQQIMLFLNRRGSARIVSCENCGWRAVCPKCDLPLIYHHDSHSLKCHVCGYKESAKNACPDCKSIDITYKSIGTKSLLQHIQTLFPRANVLRFDADSPADEQYYKHIESIKKGEVDIIVGTQLITKGIDLPNLSVLGIINADSGLNFPDYRSEEITFQQLYQATGRVGRGHVASQAFIQTKLSDHPVMQAVASRSWEDFFEYDLAKRNQYNYPPKCYMAVFKVTKKTTAAAERLSKREYSDLSDIKGLSLLGPSPCFYEKSPRGYSWQIIVKSNNRLAILKAARSLPKEWSTDIDPTSLL